MISLTRGTTYLLVAQMVFSVSGYVIHAGLGRLLTPSEYGIFGLVLYLLSLINIFLMFGIPNAASKFISENEKNTKSVKKSTLKLQVIFSVVIFVSYFLLSDFISYLLGDPGIGAYIKVSSFVIIPYSLYTLHMNFLNGLKLYGRQSKTIVLFSLAKVSGVFLLVFLGFSIFGAIAGYALASLFGFIVAGIYLPKMKAGSSRKIKERKIIDFAWPIITFSFVFTLLLNLDLIFLKTILRENALVGYYTASSMLARIPYYILPGLGFALFPAISKSTHDKNDKLTNTYIRNSMRYLLILIIPFLFVVSATSGNFISFFYSSKYTAGAGALSILIFGVSFLTVTNILSMIINASGKPRVSMVISLAMIPVITFLSFFLIPEHGLEGAAMATTITGTFGITVTSYYTVKKFGSFINFLSLARILFSSLVVYALALLIPVPNKWLLPLEYALLFSVYFFLLVLTREWRKGDYKMINKLFGRDVTCIFSKK